MSEYKSLANTEQFPAGKRVSIMREMIVSSHSDFSICIKAFVNSWTGDKFIVSLRARCDESFHHACEIQSCEIQSCEIPAKKMRPMTHAEVFSAIRNGAVIRNTGYSGVRNYWDCDFPLERHEICYNYTGTDADVWQKMEEEE